MPLNSTSATFIVNSVMAMNVFAVFVFNLNLKQIRSIFSFVVCKVGVTDTLRHGFLQHYKNYMRNPCRTRLCLGKWFPVARL
jgi:hypothetical protein